MRVLRFSIFLLMLYGLIPLTGCNDAGECGTFPLDEEARACVIQAVSDTITNYYPHEEGKEEVDLDTFRRRLDDLGATSPSLDDDQFASALQQVIATLEDGHTRLFWSTDAIVGRPLLDLIDLPEGVFVADSLIDGVSPGDRIVVADGLSTEERLARLEARISASTPQARRRIAAAALLNGEYTTEILVQFERRGLPFELLLRRVLPVGNVLVTPWSQRLGQNADIGYIAVPTFAFLDDVDAIDALIEEHFDTRGLILDIRHNGGGLTLTADLIMGRFLTERPDSFVFIDADGDVDRRFGPRPRGRRYTGKVVVLTDPLSYSAANYFAWRARQTQFATLIGESTGGGASPTRTRTLAEGLSMQYSFALMEDSRGVAEEHGITPDIAITLTPDDVALGLASIRGDITRDKVLAEAVRFLEAP